MSWSIAAAHSSSRSQGSPLPSSSHMERARRATCSVCARSEWYWAARLRTAASRTFSISGGCRPSSSEAKKTPSRRPASLTSMRVEAAGLHHRLDDHGAGQDQVGALGLDARDLRPLGGREVGEPVDEIVEHGPAQREALDAERRQLLGHLGRRGQVSHGAADARQRAAVVKPRGVLERGGDVLAQRLEVLGLDALAGQEALGHAHGAERPGAHVLRQPALDAGELHRAAAEVERDAVGRAWSS